MNEKIIKNIERIANDYFCYYKVNGNLVVFDSPEIELDNIIEEYGVRASQYFPSMVDDSWVVDFMEDALMRPNGSDWTDEDFAQVFVMKVIGD